MDSTPTIPSAAALDAPRREGALVCDRDGCIVWNIPVTIHTSKPLTEEERERLATRASDILPKLSMHRVVAIGRIRDALAKAGADPAPRQESRQ